MLQIFVTGTVEVPPDLEQGWYLILTLCANFVISGTRRLSFLAFFTAESQSTPSLRGEERQGHYPIKTSSPSLSLRLTPGQGILALFPPRVSAVGPVKETLMPV